MGEKARTSTRMVVGAPCRDVLETFKSFNIAWVMEALGRVVEAKKTRKGAKLVFVLGPPGVEENKFTVEVTASSSREGVSYRIKGGVEGRLSVAVESEVEGGCEVLVEVELTGGSALRRLLVVNPDAHVKLLNRVVSALMSKFHVTPVRERAEARSGIRDLLSLLSLVHGAAVPTPGVSRIRGLIVDVETGEVKGFEGVDRFLAEKLGRAVAEAVRSLREGLSRFGGFDKLIVKAGGEVIVVDVEGSTATVTLLKAPQ